MTLEQEELLQLYEALILPFGHPDPLGFVTRAALLSELDPNFVDGQERGFLPIRTDIAAEMTGATEVQTLQNNVITALTIDRMNFDKYQTVDDMVIATHFPDLIPDPNNRTSAQTALLNAIADERNDVYEIMYPPFATVKDVVKLLKANQNNIDVPKERLDFFRMLIGE